VRRPFCLDGDVRQPSFSLFRTSTLPSHPYAPVIHFAKRSPRAAEPRANERRALGPLMRLSPSHQPGDANPHANIEFQNASSVSSVGSIQSAVPRCTTSSATPTLTGRATGCIIAGLLSSPLEVGGACSFQLVFMCFPLSPRPLRFAGRRRIKTTGVGIKGGLEDLA
jgi:hypothetical protein